MKTKTTIGEFLDILEENETRRTENRLIKRSDEVSLLPFPKFDECYRFQICDSLSK